LKLHAEDLVPFNIVDEVIPEPLGGAHYDVEAVYASVKQFIVSRSATLRHIPQELLLEQRFQKFRSLGAVEIQKQ
jgi:acetyl-CoA carboxylase carboxyl transferase subunit alpha